MQKYIQIVNHLKLQSYNNCYKKYLKSNRIRVYWRCLKAMSFLQLLPFANRFLCITQFNLVHHLTI